MTSAVLVTVSDEDHPRRECSWSENIELQSEANSSAEKKINKIVKTMQKTKFKGFNSSKTI